jgi:hypothetical protein
MANREFNRLSHRSRMTLILWATMLVALIMHTILARAYYSLNSRSLELVASMAVMMGVEYLPANPRAAVRVADVYARDHGIAPAEIVITEPSSDNNVLTIRLDRKVPQYVSLLAVGLPAHDISVTASARLRAYDQGTVLHRASPPGILDVRVVQASRSGIALEIPIMATTRSRVR